VSAEKSGRRPDGSGTEHVYWRPEHVRREQDTEQRDAVGARVIDRADLPLDAAHPEPARDEDPVHPFQLTGRALGGLAVVAGHPLDVDPGVVGEPAGAQRLGGREVGVGQVHILPDKGHRHLMGRPVYPPQQLVPVGPVDVPERKTEPAHDVLTKGATFSQPPAYFAEALSDAERLLKYAAETGINVGDDIRNSILRARAASGDAWNGETVANLLTALTKLAVQVKPVTAESLKSYFDDSGGTVRFYSWVAIPLAIIIVLLATISFVASAISSAIRTDIATANDLAVKLRVQLGPFPAPPHAAASTR
jgi:hypothetical protein